MKRIIIVLGMHRSGTSVITKSLEVLGVTLGSDLHPAGMDNPTGFWEDRECLDINEKLLRHLGSSYDRLDMAWDDIVEDETVRALKSRAISVIANKLKMCDSVWGIKDPRMCRTLSFWGDVFTALKCDIGIVIAVRNPVSVVASLQKRNAMIAEKAYFLWLQHVLPSLGFMTDNPCRVVVDFDIFLKDPYSQITRMADKLHLSLPDHKDPLLQDFVESFLNTSLRHAYFTKQEIMADQRASMIVKDAYHLLMGLAQDEVALSDAIVKEENRVLISRLRDVFPAFDYINLLEGNGEALAVYHQLHCLLEDQAHLDHPHLSVEIKKLNLRLRKTSSEFYVDVLDSKAEVIDTQVSEIKGLYQVLEAKDHAIKLQSSQINELQGEFNELQGEFNLLISKVNDLHAELRQIRLSRTFRIMDTWANAPFGLRKFLKLIYLLAGAVIPLGLKRVLAPFILRQRVQKRRFLAVESVKGIKCNRPRILHVIANFFLGGSSRLLVDIMHALPDQYHHEILTSMVPDPPAYENIHVHVCPLGFDATHLDEFLSAYAPDIIHIHYWGDCDEPWYDSIYQVIKHRDCKVIENINTPVYPYVGDAIDHYVYVSDYVRDVFGVHDGKSETVYPGSDFELFTRENLDDIPDDCIGMVYRLENDKLNLDSIQPFIDVVKMRPETKVIIVGGGTNLAAYKKACKGAGVFESFTFTDYVSYESLPDWYSKFSIFVAPVWKESFGQVSPFAMSMGIPVVGYNVGAISEIVDTETLLVDCGDSQGLADIIVKLLDDREERLRIGAYNQKRAVEKFSVQSMIKSYDKIYGELLSKNK